MPNVGLIEALMVVFIVGIPVLLIFTLWKRSQGTPVDDWARAHEVQLTERTREVVSSHLSRNLRWRMTGALLGAILPFGTNVPGLEMIAGYLAGAILAELSAKPFADDSAHGAAVAPRFVETYVPRNALVLFRALCLAGFLVAASFFVIPLRTDDGVTIEGTHFLVASGGALVLLVVVETTLRYIARRRQSSTTEEVIAVDDALRSASMHATLGAGLGLAFLMVGAAVLGISVAIDIQWIRWAGLPISVICFLAGIVSWLRLGPDTPWSVRRLSDREVHA